MKVLHLTSVPNGGAFIAAKRIVDALNATMDVKAELWTHKEFGTLLDPSFPHFSFRLKRKLKSLLHSCRTTSNPIFYSLGLSGSGLVKRINESDADIVHLHWINEQFLSIRDIAKIRKKLVWTHHDSWAFCGTEHYPNIPEGDRRYIEGYSRKNFPPTSRGLDLDKWIYLWKKHCWQDLSCTFTAPSHWEAECLEKSALFRSRNCFVIPNTLDMKIFSPGDKIEARKKWDLPPDKKILLFGAPSLQDIRKGGHLLLEALQKVFAEDPSCLLVCFGNGEITDFTERGLECIGVGSLKEEKELALLYQASDVFICPSIIESFSNTCAESSACGVSVAAFRTGGITDVVLHEKTGFLAEPFQTDSLAEGILYCLQHQERLGKEARVHAQTHFAPEIVAGKFYALYREILRENKE